MFARRETKSDCLSTFIDCLLPLPLELQRIKDLFPEEKILESARPFYDDAMGRPSEDPVLLTNILFLSFSSHIPGDENT